MHHKGNKWQQVPVSRDGFKLLHEYLTRYRPYLANLAGIDIARKEDAVLLNGNGEPAARVLGCCCTFSAVEETGGDKWQKGFCS